MIAWLTRHLSWLKARALPQGTSPAVSALEAQREIEAGAAVLVDVREHMELAGGLAEPARWMPTSEFSRRSDIWSTFVESLPRDKRIILYCAAGVRAGRVADALADLGFTTGNLGGFRAWKQAGLPIRPRDADMRDRLGQA